MKKNHSERAHSKFSASGAERWFNCPGSVALSEGLPDKSSPWAEEGTQAHEVLEAEMLKRLSSDAAAETQHFEEVAKGKPKLMVNLAKDAADFILDLHGSIRDSKCLVETRVYLDFIDPEMFGTFDGAVIDWFGTLHVFDYKYGAGHAVSPKDNLQMIFYGLGVAHKLKWNFKQVRHWIIQPRIKGYDGPIFWDMPILTLKNEMLPLFEEAVKRVKLNPDKYVEGSWCHWCKAKSICPLKRGAKTEKAKSIFAQAPLEENETIFEVEDDFY